MNLSSIAKRIPESPIRQLVPFANAAKARGIHVYHLNIGDPDIETPEPMLKVLNQWSTNPISYAASWGEAELLESLLPYYQKFSAAKLSIKNLHITLGGSEGLLWTFLTLCNPGDEIIVFEPFYTNYQAYGVMANTKLIPILTTIENGFHLPKRAKIESKISKKTKAILICNPSNPTGVSYTKEEIEMIVDIAKRHKLYIISDEAYREFVYDGRQALSLLKYADKYKEGIIIVDSLSKRYSLCGARVGVLISCNLELMNVFLRYGQARLSAGLIDQKVAAQLKHLKKSYYTDIVKRYSDRRETLISELKKVPEIIFPSPEGAFYTIVKLPIKDASAFAKWLLTDFSDRGETIMVAPAAGCYATAGLGRDEIRIAYVLNRVALKRSVEILHKAIITYKKLRER